MRSSNKNAALKNITSKIISAQNGSSVLEYEPQKVQVDNITQSKNFVVLQKTDDYESFKIDDLISKQIGLSAAEAKKVEESIESRVIDKLKEVQERSYKEAYDLGLIEGKKKAYDDYQSLIQEQLTKFSELMVSVITMKKKILEANESQMVDLLYYMAKKIALEHIEANPSRIVPVLREVVENLSDEEKITVRISETDLQHVEGLKKELKREFEFLKKLSLISSVDVAVGGCIFETKNGVKDASIEERLLKLWKTIEEAKPKTTEKS